MVTLDELDKLAGIHVMGWELRMPSRVWIIRREKSLPAIDTGKQHNKGLYQNQWKPTRNILHAFECLEKFDAYQLFTRMRGVSPRHEAVVFTSDELTSERVYFAESDSLPEAIVRACLRAVGVNDTPVGGRGDY